jgi:crotonobetainyl-CoA:carnitine CoA-transferase CaiB-like acyl-CoA transferase
MPLPLAGVRVVDLTMVWAGPYATRMLADMGADVIKVEGVSHPDPIRAAGMAALSDVERPWDRVAYFNEYGRGKRSLPLELNRPEGRRTLLELVRTADALIENYRVGVLDGWGLGPETLLRERPDLVVVQMPGFATRGSERNLIGYGPTIEALGGLVQLSGYEDGPPQKSGISYGDPVAGVLAAGALLTGLLRRQRTGEGGVVEVSQRDNLIGLIGEAVLEYSMTGRQPPRRGNRHRWLAPQGCYPCLPLPEDAARPLGRPGMQAGTATDRWLALTVENDEQWQALCGVIGRADLAADPRYARALDRYERQDELDEAISVWTQTQEDDAAAAALQSAGVPAAAVLTPLALTQDPHLAARGFFREQEHLVAGRYRVAGPLWNLPDGEPHLRAAAPAYGQHRRVVLNDLLGLTDSAIEELEREGITADAPHPVRRT